MCVVCNILAGCSADSEPLQIFGVEMKLPAKKIGPNQIFLFAYDEVPDPVVISCLKCGSIHPCACKFCIPLLLLGGL